MNKRAQRTSTITLDWMAPFILEAAREVDAMLPATPPIAPPELTAEQKARAMMMANAYAGAPGCVTPGLGHGYDDAAVCRRCGLTAESIALNFRRCIPVGDIAEILGFK